jgi:hypothetical protein
MYGSRDRLVIFDALDFAGCISLREDKLKQFRSIRETFDVNPALGFACVKTTCPRK